jgi:hypothetical protein
MKEALENSVNIVTCTVHLYEGVLDWKTEFINTLYIHTARDYRQYSATAILHTFQLTVDHSLGSSVLTSRFLTTDI